MALLSLSRASSRPSNLSSRVIRSTRRKASRSKKEEEKTFKYTKEKRQD